MNDWWEAFWFFLPAGIANMAPVFANSIPGINRWNAALDFGRSWRGKRIFGDSKTWRGVLFGVFVAVVVGLLQYRVIASSAESTSFIILATAVMGLGALLGDALKSFFKRRRDFPPGENWLPFDQIDYIIGGLLFVYPLVHFSLPDALMILIMYSLLHLSVNYIGYLIGMRQKPF